MSVSARVGALAALSVALSAGVAPAAGEYGLGTPATAEQIAGWDIDVRPDGVGLPPGRGTAEQGERIYGEQCARCHGEFGEGAGNYPVLMGGIGSLTRDRPLKTIGSYWPYATTVFDYVRRAKPFGHAQTLDNDQVYALTALLLHLNELVAYEEVMDATTLPAVQMPNRDGFIEDDRPDTPLGEPCMRDCRGPVTVVVGKARVIDVTPEEAPEDADAAGVDVARAEQADPARGEKVFRQCAVCHSLAEGEHRFGPSLHGLVGRKAGSVASFERYSAAMRASSVVWDEYSLARFSTAPQAFIAGTNMPFAGIKDEASVRDLVAYLLSGGVQ